MDIQGGNKMKEKFKIIKKHSQNKLRDVEIAIAVALKVDKLELASKYNLEKSRIRTIYRIYMAHLNEQLYDIPYSRAVNDKHYYNRSNALDMLTAYKEFLIDYLSEVK